MSHERPDFAIHLGQEKSVCPILVSRGLPGKLPSGAHTACNHSGHSTRLILNGWVFSDEGQRRAIFKEHPAWPDDRDGVDFVIGFLESLSPRDGHSA